MDTLENIKAQIQLYIGEIGSNAIASFLLGLVILLAGLKIAKLIINIIGRTKSFSGLDLSVQTFLKSLLKIVLYAFVISSAAICWGMPTTSFVTVFTSAGVTIGLALQGALSNFAGGLLILMFKPFKVGDYIESGVVSGRVKAITVIYTVVVTSDNKTITIPNGSLTNSNIIDHSTQASRRVDITLSVQPDADITQVRSLLLSTAERLETVLRDPAPLVYMVKKTAGQTDLILSVWCTCDDRQRTAFGLIELLADTMKENKIAVTGLQTDVTNK